MLQTFAKVLFTHQTISKTFETTGRWTKPFEIRNLEESSVSQQDSFQEPSLCDIGPGTDGKSARPSPVKGSTSAGVDFQEITNGGAQMRIPIQHRPPTRPCGHQHRLIPDTLNRHPNATWRAMKLLPKDIAALLRDEHRREPYLDLTSGEARACDCLLTQ